MLIYIQLCSDSLSLFPFLFALFSLSRFPGAQQFSHSSTLTWTYVYTSISQMSSKAKATSSLNASLSLSSEQSEARKRLNLVCQNFVEIVPSLTFHPCVVVAQRYLRGEQASQKKSLYLTQNLLLTLHKLVFHSAQLFIFVSAVLLTCV